MFCDARGSQTRNNTNNNNCTVMFGGSDQIVAFINCLLSTITNERTLHHLEVHSLQHEPSRGFIRPGAVLVH